METTGALGLLIITGQQRANRQQLAGQGRHEDAAVLEFHESGAIAVDRIEDLPIGFERIVLRRIENVSRLNAEFIEQNPLMAFDDAIAPTRFSRREWACAAKLPAELRRRLAERLGEAVWLEAAAPRHRFWSRLLVESGSAAAPQPSEALARSLALVEASLGGGPVPLSRAAACAGLSAERYRHLFVEIVGLPFRRYVLWRRLQRAFRTLEAGGDVTSAAHDAGFADSAHFARTLRAMLGVRATQLTSGR